MGFGLFGKLQSKRDFIAIATPRAFLSTWEPWVQGGISASRTALVDKWQQAFLTAPIWRFWLGPDLCGTAATGAIMPSMDGVGRYFPLTVVALAGEGEAPPPPEIDPQDEWFATIEDFLFSTLDAGRTFEAVTAALAALPPPPPGAREIPAGVESLAPRAGVIARGEGGYSGLFSQARQADHTGACAAMTFWWTAGGEGYPPVALACPRMPDPWLFTGMLTGDFASIAIPSRPGTAA